MRVEVDGALRSLEVNAYRWAVTDSAVATIRAELERLEGELAVERQVNAEQERCMRGCGLAISHDCVCHGLAAREVVEKGIR